MTTYIDPEETVILTKEELDAIMADEPPTDYIDALWCDDAPLV